jgi:hypothetical protein
MNVPSRTTVVAWENATSAQLIDEAERMATFDQSARTVNGQRAEYQQPRIIEERNAA